MNLLKDFKDDNRNLLILCVLYLLIHIPLLFYLPFVKDEAIYAIMIKEQLKAPTILPTFLGYPTSWKPPIFFWVYAPFQYLPLQLEASFRFPSLLFGLLTIPILYRLMINLGASKLVSFFTNLIIVISFLGTYPQVGLLQDSLLFLLICSALYLYTNKGLPNWKFLAAGVVVFIAFATKLVIAALIPVLAIVYYILKEKDRKILLNPFFLVSLLAVPIGLVLHLSLLNRPELVNEIYVSTILDKVIGGGLEGGFSKLIGSVLTLFMSGAIIWILLSFSGLVKFWKKEKFMVFWFIFALIPIYAATFMPWYYLPVMPTIAYFASLVLLESDGKQKTDLFFWIFFAMICISNFVLMGQFYKELYNSYSPEKEAGLFLSSKENVLIIGTYRPGVPSYTILGENNSYTTKDFGWILVPEHLTKERIESLITNYHQEYPGMYEGSFNFMFTLDNASFRKNCNITKFDYVALIEMNKTLAGKLVFNKSDIQIYDIRSQYN
jgi:4-amino-4-deoxy-L-arabinose transferase-like glycosyltransferase